MNKTLKKIVLGSLCLVLGGVTYIANGLKSERLEYKALKQAEIKIHHLSKEEAQNIGFKDMPISVEYTCITDEEVAKEKIIETYNNSHPATPITTISPGVSYVIPSYGTSSTEIVEWNPLTVRYDDGTEEIYYCEWGDIKSNIQCEDGREFTGYYTNIDYNEDSFIGGIDELSRLNVQDVATKWYFKRDNEGCIKSFSYTTILYAKCDEVVDLCLPNGAYKVNYIDGKTLDQLYEPKTVERNSTPGLGTPSAEGYAFEGWYFDRDYRVQVTASNYAQLYETYLKTDDDGCPYIELYAKFNEKKCEVYNGVAYYYSDGELYRTVNLNGENIESQIDLTLEPPKKEEYKFLGWFSRDDEQGVKIETIDDLKRIANTLQPTIDENNCTVNNTTYKLYAKWEKEKKICDDDYDISYKVYYYYNDSEKGLVELKEHETLDYGNFPKMFEPEAPEGYVFKEWYTEDGSVINDFSKIKINEVKDEEECTKGYTDVKLYAKFVKCYVFEGKAYYYDGTDLVKTIDLYRKTENGKESNQGKIDLTPLEKEGFEFVGWFSDDKFENEIKSEADLKLITDAAGVSIDENKCTRESGIYNLYAKFNKVDPNPETGDMIYVYIGLGVVLLAASGLTIKKIMNK